MNARIISSFILLPLALTAQSSRDAAPLKHWAAPLYWQPSPSEDRTTSVHAEAAGSSLSPNQTGVAPAGALVFVGMTPCRVVDTRTGAGFTGDFGPPSLPNGVRTFPIQSSTRCTIPSAARAYSFNVTAVPPGVLGYITVYPTGQPQPLASTLNDLQGTVVANAAVVQAGTNGSVDVYANNPTDVIIDINGYYASLSDVNNNTAVGIQALSSNTTGSNNTGMGVNALTSNTTGSFNTATGVSALYNNNTGSNNTGVGSNALAANTQGNQNTAVGDRALAANTTGNQNTASGNFALFSNTTGFQNTASGVGALQANTNGIQNTAVGVSALQINSTGGGNTATGYSALQNNTNGSGNTANGSFALQNNTTGVSNTATGVAALETNTSGDQNTAFGRSALLSNTIGAANTATGVFALSNNSTGNQNTAFGNLALTNNATGSNNIAIGYTAAQSVSSSSSNNIHIGNPGIPPDNGTIRIGSGGAQSSFFVAGVRGATTGQANAVSVMIDSNGQLGTVSSSRRYKEDIQDMGDSSSGLLRLRPVTFRYKQPYADGSKPLDYGLIAEEVAEIYPDLAVKGADGAVETVQYQKLNVMLLNEVQKELQQSQKQHRRIEEQNQQIEEQQQELGALKARLSDLEKVLERLVGATASR